MVRPAGPSAAVPFDHSKLFFPVSDAYDGAGHHGPTHVVKKRRNLRDGKTDSRLVEANPPELLRHTSGTWELISSTEFDATVDVSGARNSAHAPLCASVYELAVTRVMLATARMLFFVPRRTSSQ